MFQTPQQLGYQFMQFPVAQKPNPIPMQGPNPAMVAQANALAAQPQQQQSPLSQVAGTINGFNDLKSLSGNLTSPESNPLAQMPQASAKPQDYLPVAPGVYPTLGALENAEGPLYRSAYQAQQAQPLLQRLLGSGLSGLFSR